LLRSFGLVALDRIDPLQALFVRRGMGFRGSVPRLALADSGDSAGSDSVRSDAARAGRKGARK
jgi:hypothetical protein